MLFTSLLWQLNRGGSRTIARSKMERFVITVNGFLSLTIITKHSILDVAAVLDPPLIGSKAFFLPGIFKFYNFIMLNFITSSNALE